MARQERRRAISALVTIIFSIFLIVAPLVAMAIAQSTPRISFLNPSDYSAGASDAPLTVSDRSTGSDEEDSVNENTYRLSVYTANTPANALVEFELDSLNLGPATRVAPDAFEFNWDVGTLVPGLEYTLRAILYSGSGIGATEVARAEQIVVATTPNSSAAADIVYPAGGAQTGFYVNPLNGTTNTVIRAEYSAGTTTVRAFYTVSDAGDPPVWKPCTGATAVSGDQPQATTGGQVTLRCVLQAVDQGAGSVTALGVVSNNAQRRAYNQNFNQAGDGIRVFPYEQDATTTRIDAPTVRMDGDLGNEEVCSSPAQYLTVLDQLEHPIAGMSVDVHAQGPNDQLAFDTGGFFTLPPNDGNSPPDQGHTGLETAYDCSEDVPLAGEQGDHNIPGTPDIKHIEGSSDNTGSFGFVLSSTAAGTTQVTMWADEDDDDRYCDDEPASAASLGWNMPAPAPAGETPIVFDCPIPEPPPPPSEASPSTSPPDPQPGDCTVEGTEGDDEIRGTEGNDIICAGAGDDDIRAFGGDDIIRGESGNDIIQGDSGDDTIDGGTGNDRLNGGFDNDLIDGAGGTDVLVGGQGNDVLRGSAALDGLQGGSGDDVIQGGGGDDVADGQPGKDILKGFNGEDILRGGGGPDNIRGMNSNDQLTGGGGNDKINGGEGRDQCSGGKGRDKLSQCE